MVAVVLADRRMDRMSLVGEDEGLLPSSSCCQLPRSTVPATA